MIMNKHVSLPQLKVVLIRVALVMVSVHSSKTIRFMLIIKVSVRLKFIFRSRVSLRVRIKLGVVLA